MPAFKTARQKILVDEKIRIGDWEGDTIIGAKHQGAIVSYVDKCSKFTILKKVANKTSEFITQATIEKLGKSFLPVLTITYDNSKEFSDHASIACGYLFCQTLALMGRWTQ